MISKLPKETKLPKGMFAVLVRYPSLWYTALCLSKRLGWVPASDYIRFRMVTMYGDSDAQLQPTDLVAYLRWCRSYYKSANKPFQVGRQFY